MRKLASIQRITSLTPIPEADAILKATVLGWELVVKKGEFEVGDLCVYCEIDSILPDKPAFEFLKNRGFRIKTIRLRGQVSQGICLPLSVLPADVAIEEDKDLTEILEIEKYEPQMPASLSGEMEGLFPSFIPKTDETRVQVLQGLLDKYKDQTFYVTEKLDGTSATYFIKDDVFGVCSRNFQLKETENNTFWEVARKENIEEKLKSLGGNWAIQGELVGEGIQKNKCGIKGHTLFVFNVFNIDNFKFLSLEDFIQTVEKIGLKTVPVLEKDFIMTNHIPTLVQKSIGASIFNAKMPREGLVFRPVQEAREMRGGRVSFKAINTEFLLKFE